MIPFLAFLGNGGESCPVIRLSSVRSARDCTAVFVTHQAVMQIFILPSFRHSRNGICCLSLAGFMQLIVGLPHERERRRMIMASYAMPALSGDTGLTRYLTEIRKFPLLEPQKEYMLAKRYREHDDAKAAHQLVTSHLRLVAKIAMKYRGYGLPIGEVVSEGNVGLMQAVKRFEPDRGFRLATYAMWWIKASIQEYVLRSWSLVKMGTTANQKKLFFNLRKAKSQIQALGDGDLRPEQVSIIATKLGVHEKEVVDMNRRLSGDSSLNTPLSNDGDSGDWQDFLVDDKATPETMVADSEEKDNRSLALTKAMETLNLREQRIIEARRLIDDPMTLEALAEEFNVSRERVRQIEVRAFEKLQIAVVQGLAQIESHEAEKALLRKTA
jgi:RNA polymerase sigma-32 factor